MRWHTRIAPFLEGPIATAILAPALVLFYHSISGDASIFFTFFKQFFSLPFSYQPGTVSFGASSPLHVLVNAPIHFAAGAYWLPMSKLFNYLLIVLGVVLLNRALQGELLTLLVILFLTVLNRPLLMTTSQLFETGLTFFVVSLAYYFVKRRQHHAAILVAGVMYLARPELALVAIALDGYLWLGARDRGRVVGSITVSGIPAAVYHAYMLAHTGAYLPSSVYMRGLEAFEGRLSWADSLANSILPLRSEDGTLYLVGLVTLVILAARKRLASYAKELIFLLPLPCLYIAVPPRQYLIRYLLPITPIISVVIARELQFILGCLQSASPVPPGSQPSTKARWIERTSGPLLLLLILGTYRGYFPYHQHPRYDYDTLLLRDLAEKLNPIAAEGDRLFLYEIQGQYYLKTFCYSPDSLVGNQLFDVVHRKDTYESFIGRHRVKYIVTMNSYNYRRVFAGTLLERLYLHDLSSTVGDTVDINGVRLRKILTNPVFSDPRYYMTVSFSGLNTGNSLRVYGEWNRLWRGHHPLWNSVYLVQHESAAARLAY